MISDHYVKLEKPESKKDLKPKVITRPKDVKYKTRDVVADRQSGGYQTR